MILNSLGDEGFKKLWRMTDWDSAKEALRAYQREIAFAASDGNKERIAETQKRLVQSIEARQIAVRHVCDSVAQSGIDGVKWESDADKMKAALSLDSKDYKAQPMRLLIIRPKGHTKSRHIQIPTYYDRAMQTLHAFSLDPVSETLGERKSFAFRKGRSLFDIHSHMMKSFEMENPPHYIINADVKACYASISHAWLLNNIPMDTHVLNEFLKAGHVFCGEIFPPDDFGISLGSSISHILGNMTLDGAQQAIFDGLYGGKLDVDYSNGNLLRFADDIIITAQTKGSVKKIMAILKEFLAVRGLQLSEEKTKIVNLANGFDFLSRRYQYIDGFVRAAPSEAAISKMEQGLCELIIDYRGGQKALIDKLNKKLAGWANYHKVTEALWAFKHIDNVAKTLLLELCEKLSPLLSRERVIDKYFYQDADGEYVYALTHKPDVRVRRLAQTVLVNHRPVSTKKNPYLDGEYFENRNEERAIMTATGKYKPIWLRQRGRCFYCRKNILLDQRRTIVSIDPLKRDSVSNLAYIHEHCSKGQAEFYDSEHDVESRFDLHALLTQIAEGRPPFSTRKKVKFFPLIEHFRQRKEAVFTLTFKEIEKINGEPLVPSAFKYESYWHGRSPNRISFRWISNGYEIRSLNLKEKRIVFERVKDKGEAVEIPAVFLSGRIPPDAKAEMVILFDYIRNKYGL